MVSKILVAVAFTLALPFLASAQETTASPLATSTPPAFLKDIKTNEDLAKLTPEQDKELVDFMRQEVAKTQTIKPTPTPSIDSASSDRSLNLSVLTPKVLIAVALLLVSIGFVFYYVWRKKKL